MSVVVDPVMRCNITTRVFRVNCSSARHIVELRSDDSVSYVSHVSDADVLDLINNIDRQKAMDILSGEVPGDYRITDGCAIIALALREHRLLTSHPDSGVRQLLAVLRGRALARTARGRHA